MRGFHCVAFGLAVFLLTVAPQISEADKVRFGDETYAVEQLVVAKSSSARLARFEDGNPEMLKKHIYLPAGTLLYLLDRTGRDRRTFQLAVSEFGMPIYVLGGNTNYFPADRFGDLQTEFAALPRENVPVQTELYGEITLTPSEIYAMEFAPDRKINLRIGADKMQDKFIEDIWVTVSEDSFGIVPLPIDAAAPPPDPISLYDLEAAFENLWDSIESRDSDQFDEFRDYFFGRLVINKECQQTITFDLGVDGSLAAQFDTWLSPVTAELALSGAIQSSTTFGAGREFRIERFNIGNRVYEVMDEAVAPDCISLDDQRRIRIASRRIVAQLNSSDAQDLQLKTDAKGRLIYSCRSEYQKIAQTLYDQELNEAPTRLLISQFTTFRDPGNVARCN